MSRGYYTAGINGGWQFRVNEWDTKAITFSCTNGASSTASWIGAGSAFTEEVWNHIAAVRSGTTFNIYLNGVALTPASTSGNIGTFDFVNNTSALMVGHETTYQSGVGAHFGGYLDEIRVSKGIARWTSAFTPPIRRYTNKFGIQGREKDTGNTLFKLGEDGNEIVGWDLTPGNIESDNAVGSVRLSSVSRP
jgi:hypothetical protein